ncbi:MAG: putative metal-dependent phosphoesterase (PHP family) [Ktedonobacterales bacterium]|jgi:predicted metal-dependent phosphoesterase TrpH|nr:MAG: putative metal-dependent phosphoesterase (PHP family) [Ktedonobacterales bacterium]
MSALRLKPDDAVDLHIHTMYSDGHWQPVELFGYLAGAGFRLVAVTDHDRVDRLAEMRALGESRGIVVLPGVEMTTNWQGKTLHLLCYGGDLAGGALARMAEATVEGMRENTREVYAELERRGYIFGRREEVLAGQGGQALRPVDNARLLLAHGHVATMAEALVLIADAGYRIVSAPVADAVAAAQAVGAVALVAHPGRQDGEIPRHTPGELAEMLASAPFDGVEAYYPLHSAEQVKAYEGFAHERGLLVSAGSDSHGPRQRLPIAYRAGMVAALLGRCGVEVEGT